MIEKVNPCHPDKVADRIAGAIVDVAYNKQENPKIAVEVLIGHGHCHIIAETNIDFYGVDVHNIVERIAGDMVVDFKVYNQDVHLAENQSYKARCGDNGIFKGVPLTEEQKRISEIARTLYSRFESDGKYIIDGDRIIICQSNATNEDIKELIREATDVNPLGYWTGGTTVDTGATNRKLGSDMADSVTGGGLHGKDFSKADVSVNIYAFLKAQEIGKPIEISCAIGDEIVDGKPYAEIINIAKEYVKSKGGFEKFAEWGLY